MSIKSRVKYFLLNHLPSVFFRYAPYYKRSYLHYWVGNKGKEYRKNTYLRQSKDGTLPLISNPAVTEIRKELDKYAPESVLEIGCGWGRLLSELVPFYRIEGCDISEEYLAQCPPETNAFKCDIITGIPNRKWDVVFTRAVIQYFVNDTEVLLMALQNVESTAKRKVIFWEWPHVCAEIQKTYPSDKFEFRHMKYREE